MAKRYQIWDKVSNVIVPTGQVFTPEQWKEQYPVANTDIDIVIAGGSINGAFFGIYPAMVQMYEEAGCDFSECETKQDYLDAIEAFENEQNQPKDIINDNTRIADALEDLVVLNMPDVEEE